MADHMDRTFSAAQLVWVGVIALVAATLTTWLRTGDLATTVIIGALAAVISVAIVWFVDWTRRPR